jgi:hypothetical protein
MCKLLQASRLHTQAFSAISCSCCCGTRVLCDSCSHGSQALVYSSNPTCVHFCYNSVGKIDGPGGALAQSGPSVVRDATASNGKAMKDGGIPVSGTMEFDIADLAESLKMAAYSLSSHTRWATCLALVRFCTLYS